MITHHDPEIEFLVHMLAGQRDLAMGQAAKLFKENKSLKEQVEQLKAMLPADQE